MYMTLNGVNMQSGKSCDDSPIQRAVADIITDNGMHHDYIDSLLVINTAACKHNMKHPIMVSNEVITQRVKVTKNIREGTYV